MRTKSFKRALAVTLSLAMVVTAAGITPGKNAEAATKKYAKSLKVSKSKVTMKTGGKKVTLKATVAVKGKVSKKIKVKSSKTSIVKVSVGKANKKGVSRITLIPKKAGKATITVTTAAKNKKNKKLTKKIQVVVQGGTTGSGIMAS